MSRLALFSLGCVGVFVASVASADDFKPRPFDWPQWQGPDRTAISREEGLLKSWPNEGPKLAWKVKNLGGGWSTPTVAAGRIFGMSYRGRDEVVWCLKESDGSELWSTKIAATTKVGYDQGSRCSPTVDGDFLYVLGVGGELACLTVAKGDIVWSKNLPADFGGKFMANWGYCESPLIDGDKLVCAPGKSNTIVALDKKKGTTIWTASIREKDDAGYASMIAVEIDGTRQYVAFLQKGVVSVAAKDGKFLWRWDRPANRTGNCSTPIYHDGHVFASSAYNTGGGVVKIKGRSDKFDVEEVWFSKNIKNHHGGCVLIDGHLYGADGGNNDRPGLVCIEFLTGKEKWREPGKGSLSVADGMIYFREESGRMFLIEPNSEKYVEKGKFNQPDRTRNAAWAHPVIANGKLYLRDQDVLLCYDVKATK
jgi:outer membrane protein assembly factor BamB